MLLLLMEQNIRILQKEGELNDVTNSVPEREKV